MFYQILKHTHSGLRWLVLAALLIAIFNALFKLVGKKDFLPDDKRLNVISLSLLHVQFLVGILLYFISPMVVFSTESMSNQLLRFYLIEHSIMMLLAVVLVTVGYSMSKKVEQSMRKHRRIFLFYLLALVIIFLAIPWPWMNLTGGWI